jgi:hypothetical protein
MKEGNAGLWRDIFIYLIGLMEILCSGQAFINVVAERDLNRSWSIGLKRRV